MLSTPLSQLCRGVRPVSVVRRILSLMSIRRNLPPRQCTRHQNLYNPSLPRGVRPVSVVRRILSLMSIAGSFLSGIIYDISAGKVRDCVQWQNCSVCIVCLGAMQGMPCVAVAPLRFPRQFVVYQVVDYI